MMIQPLKQTPTLIPNAPSSKFEIKSKALKPFSSNRSTSCSFFKRIIHAIGWKKSPLCQKIREIAIHNSIMVESQEKIASVLKALKSPDFSSMKKDLKVVIKNMSIVEKRTLLETALHKDFKKGENIHGNHCLYLMHLEDLHSVIKDLTKSIDNEKLAFVDVQTTAQEFCDLLQNIKKYNVEDARLRLLNHSKEFAIVRFFKNLLRTLAIAFSLVELGKEPSSYFETKYMLDIYWKLIEIPVKIIKFIISFFINPLISAAIIVGGAVISTLASLIFKKWLSKCPDQLPDCTNLTDQIKKGMIKPIYGRDNELDKIINTLAANNETDRKHPLIEGDSGVGKSSLMFGLAWRIANGEVPDILKNKKLFYVNTAELLKKVSPFALKDPLQLIMDKIANHKHEVILIFEEAHNLAQTLKERFKSLLDTSVDSLYYAIGITTPSEYAEHIEPSTLKRRFEKIKISSTSKKQTLTILRNMLKQEAPDIILSNKVLNIIYKATNKKIDNAQQPSQSINILSKVIEKIRRLQNGGALSKHLHTLTSKKEDLTSKLSRTNIQGLSIKSKKTQKIIQQLQSVEKEIDHARSIVERKKQTTALFNKLKGYRKSLEQLLYTSSTEIATHFSQRRKTPEIIEKMYLFNAYFLLPQLDKYLLDFVRLNKHEITLRKKIITKIINKMAKKSVENAQVQLA